ncbi:MAG: Rrf2 family transcriptional regulator [Treponema sp.]|jgi:Rrf2 family iron-sulfur cluster assembly transcriptional regulator|nr:Rrf2 family transcriptional regulator [Treponema sp.]
MRITTRGRYALRASLALAEMGRTGEMVSINSLSEAEDISPIFLEQIFFHLKKAGLVKSVRGPGGGFNLAHPPEKMTVREILLASGESLSPGNCDKHKDNCTRYLCCKSHKVWIKLCDVINEFFQSITLASLLEDDKGKDSAEHKAF